MYIYKFKKKERKKEGFNKKKEKKEVDNTMNDTYSCIAVENYY